MSNLNLESIGINSSNMSGPAEGGLMSQQLSSRCFWPLSTHVHVSDLAENDKMLREQMMSRGPIKLLLSYNLMGLVMQGISMHNYCLDLIK